MKTFGKYQLFEEIGKSPAGTTYQAIDQLSGRAVVVKTLNSAGLAPEAKTRLCHELTACAEFQHPNIVRILDTGEIDGAIYVATELLHGIDLGRHLLEGPKLPLARKLRIMAQIYDGLALAHQKQITHGGIKPANIFLADQDEIPRYEAKILDFGIAKLSGQPDSIAADLFFTAAVLYEFVTGIAPFEPKALRKIDAEIPEDLDRLVTAALAKDPHQRPQTAEIMAASLCAIAKQLPQPAEPVRAQPAIVSAPLAATAAAGASSAMKSAAVPSAPAAAGAISKPEPVASAAPQPARDVSPDSGKAEPAAASQIQLVLEKAPPAQIKPKSSPVPAAAKRSPVRAGIAVAAGAILALFIMAGLLSKQTSNATQSSKPIQAPAAVSAPPSENVTPVTQPSAPPAQVAVDQPKAEPVATAADQILTGQVQVLWESGEYARALILVDAILTAEPANAEALTWKKKILTAQQAEAALR